MQPNFFINFTFFPFLFILLPYIYWFPFWIINLNGLEIFNQFFNRNININLEPFGQLHQYIVRANNSSLNISGFIENIKILNWAYMPLIGPILFILGIINIYKKNKKIFFTIFLYLFLFNFYFSGNTGQHIQTLFIMIFAFSINELINFLKSETLFKYVLFTKIVILMLFTYNFNLKIYNEENYPYKFEKLFFFKI